MLVCPKCNNEQGSGKFCGVCGTAVQPAMEEATLQQNVSAGEPQMTQADAEPTTPPVQQTGNVATSQAAAATATTESKGQDTLEKVKKELGNYWSYFLHMIKNPARGFQNGENQFINGLVTLGLYAVLFALSLYFLGNSLMSAMGGGLFSSESLPFFSIVPRLIIFIFILFAISFGSAFIMSKAGKNQESFKHIISQYGAIIVPFTALNLVGVLGGLIGSIQLTLISIGASMIFTFIFIPVLFVYEKVKEATSESGQRIYLSLVTIVIISVVSFMLGDALIVNLLDEMPRLF